MHIKLLTYELECIEAKRKLKIKIIIIIMHISVKDDL